MRILLTGGTGWVGRSLGIELVRRGHEIIGLTRDPDRARLNAPYPARWLKWDSAESDLPQELMSLQLDAVLNLVGEPIASERWTKKVKDEIRSSRVEATHRIAKLVERRKIPIFVSASAIGYYGDRGEEILTEASPPGEGFLPEVCKEWEASVLKTKDIARCVCLRIGIVLGRDGGALSEMLPAFKMGFGGPMAGGQQWMSWIHFDDLQRLIVEALENPNYVGPLNATAPQPVRQREFAKTLGNVLRRPTLVAAPRLALRLAFGELAQLVLASQKVMPSVPLKNHFEYSFPDLKSALAHILKPEKSNEALLVERQFVNRPIHEVFPFYASEMNLERLTPPFLNFRVLGKNTTEIEEGTLIDYRMTLHGIPFGWRTKILNWTPPYLFTDTQLKGPYNLWHHTHKFESLGTGTLITDVVRYIVPFGPLGALVAGWKVDQDVKTIFAYRRKIIGTEVWP